MSRFPRTGDDKEQAVSIGWFFALFFVSGFCSILYEIIWLRLAMAKFGVTSGLLSIVLSMFMAGLGFGSWASGRLIRKYRVRLASQALRLYALTELSIGISAVVVPWELAWGRNLLAHFSLASPAAYYLASGVWMALTLVPWCACMGATIPFAMLAIANGIPRESQRSFSYLYLANVVGAALGSTLPLLLIEIYGFHGTLKIGSALNAVLAVSALVLALRMASRVAAPPEETSIVPVPGHRPTTGRVAMLLLLFATGCTSMGVEVVWVRQFTPYQGTVVYAFATILGLYLVATFLGSRIYRYWSRHHSQMWPLVWAVLGLSGLLAGVATSPQFNLPRLLRLCIGIVPLSGILGFVTPMLVDRWSGGDPDKGGTAYAVNVAGCIVGPILSGFLLLPLMSERWVLLLFSLPWLVLGAIPEWSPALLTGRKEAMWRRAVSYAVIALGLVVVLKSNGFEEKFARRETLRDNTATIIAMGEGMDKHLLVNGVGITALTPITKMMAHLPLASLNHPPQNVLAVCFGMGTTYRSLLSWNVSTTVVELVPSVPKLLWYFHPDAPALLHSPLSHVVIDDGREYLERTSQQYDVITIDPPPPVEAAGSSLLYSEEFYSTIRRRLKPGGILQQWLPTGDHVVRSSVARALAESFPYVRVFSSVKGWGFHFLASNEPIENRTPEELAERMPASAIGDLIEWGPETTAQGNFAIVLNSEFPLSRMIAESPTAPPLQDDRPTNEYFWLRRRLARGLWHYRTSLDGESHAPPRSGE
jgi:spermidine synthase